MTESKRAGTAAAGTTPAGAAAAESAGAGTAATALSQAVVEALLAVGVREVVLAPGSRNAPLGFAVFDAEQAGRLRLHTRIDERTAGFLALGLAKTGPPAAVMCTSGTAVANLHPALLEALHAGVPVIAVTADRPVRLRGTSANQTTDQSAIFPGVTTYDVSAVDDLPSLEPGRTPWATPVHLNVCLDEPLLPPPAEVAGSARRSGSYCPPKWQDLSPEVGVPARRGGSGGASKWQDLSAEVAGSDLRRSKQLLEIGPRTVVVAGDDAGPPPRILAQEAGWPLFAEPSSGSRTGTHALRTYRLLLDGDLGSEIERVVVYGHPTLSRPVSRLLARDDVEVLAAEPPGGLPLTRPFAVAGTAPGYQVEQSDESGWLERWRTADSDRAGALDSLLQEESSLAPHLVAGAVANALPAGGLLVVGASSPIRDLDLMVPRYRVGDRRKVIANRGLSGIDGTLSTAIGAALARESTRSLALMGDVTFLHDASALVMAPREARPELTVVVVNDDGGSIFTMLEQGDPAYGDRFETLFGTPHGTDLASLCAAHRIPHWRIDGRGEGSAPDALAELRHALESPAGGIEVIEVLVRRDHRRDLDARIRALRPDHG